MSSAPSSMLFLNGQITVLQSSFKEENFTVKNKEAVIYVWNTFNYYLSIKEQVIMIWSIFILFFNVSLYNNNWSMD